MTVTHIFFHIGGVLGTGMRIIRCTSAKRFAVDLATLGIAAGDEGDR